MRFRDFSIQQARIQISGLSEPQFSYPENGTIHIPHMIVGRKHEVMIDLKPGT